MGSGDNGTATYALATFGVFAAIGPSLFGFGVGVADERAANLIELKRVSPLPGGAYVVGKIAASVLYGGRGPGDLHSGHVGGRSPFVR